MTGLDGSGYKVGFGSVKGEDLSSYLAFFFLSWEPTYVENRGDRSIGFIKGK